MSFWLPRDRNAKPYSDPDLAIIGKQPLGLELTSQLTEERRRQSLQLAQPAPIPHTTWCCTSINYSDFSDCRVNLEFSLLPVNVSTCLVFPHIRVVLNLKNPMTAISVFHTTLPFVRHILAAKAGGLNLVIDN